MQNRTFLFVAVCLFLTASPSVAQSAEEEAVKAVVADETTAFYQRQADAWASTRLQDAKVSSAIIENGNYSTAVGWEKVGPEVINYLKAHPKPLAVEVARDSYLIRMSGDMAWVEYDQTMRAPTIDPLAFLTAVPTPSRPSSGVDYIPVCGAVNVGGIPSTVLQQIIPRRADIGTYPTPTSFTSN